MTMPVAPSLKIAFTRPDMMPGPLSAEDAAVLMSAVGDVTFILSGVGRILDVAVSQTGLASQGFADMIGEAWVDTVTIESRPKIQEMLSEAAVAGSAPRWRQVNHPTAGGDVPISYLTMAVGDGDRLIAVGRDMRGAAAVQQRLLQTQQSLERDYIRLRQVETRYRLLFDMSSEPVFIADAATRRIREANPAAHRLLDAPEGSLVGKSLATIVDPRDRDDFIAYLGASEATDDLVPASLRLGKARGEARISARLFRQARSPLMLVRISMADRAASDHPYDAALSAVVERMPDAFVLVDRQLTVLAANTAFIELAEMPSLERVTGQGLGNWLGRPGIDLDLILTQLREHGWVRNVSTILRGMTGGEEDIELSGVVAPMGDSECYGFTIRAVARRLDVVSSVPRDAPRSVEQLTELVGRMPLKDIVRESTDMIERLCIEAALAYTSDNRASAAEILGVSRQSLYSKLHRHRLGNLVGGHD
jgi:transcriptional regulator PpsR